MYYSPELTHCPASKEDAHLVQEGPLSKGAWGVSYQRTSTTSRLAERAGRLDQGVEGGTAVVYFREEG